MTIRTFDLPEKAAAQMISLPQFVGLTVSSWRDGAYATGDLLVQAANVIPSIEEDAERAYLAWEVITNVVELTEMVATVWLNRKAPSEIPAHRASNLQIEKFWKSVVSSSLTPEEIRAFLRLEGARGFSPNAQRTVRALTSVAEKVSELLKTIATFWIERADSVRWFRHFPASLTPDETWFIDSNNDMAPADFTALFGDFDDVLEFVTRMDGNTFNHTLIRFAEVRYAVRLGDAAIQLIMNWLANSGLDPKLPKRRRHIFPAFADKLTQEERAALLADGNYVLELQ